MANVAHRECSGDVHGCSPCVFFKWRKKASLLRNAYRQLSSSRALRPSRTMHSRQQSRLDPSPFIVRTVIGFRHSIAGQPPKQAASCLVRSVTVVYPGRKFHSHGFMRMSRGYSVDRSSSGSLAMLAASSALVAHYLCL